MSDDPNYVHGRITGAADATPVTEAQATAAYHLLYALMAAAYEYEVQLSDFDPFIDLPAACLKVAAALDLPAA